MSFLRMRRKFVLGTRTPAVGALQLQPRNQTVNGTGGGTGTLISGLPFNDGFESGNFNLWNAVGGTVTNVTAEHFEGARAASTSVSTGQQSDNYLEYHFGDHLGVGGTPTGTNEIWCRFAHKWASNYVDSDPNIQAQKLWLLNFQNPTSNRRRYQITFNIGSSGAYFFDLYRWNEDTTFGGVLHTISIPFTRVKGRWEEFVFRIVVNTPGVSNGQLDCWTKAEGDTSYTQQLSRTNLNMRDATSFTPNRLIGLSNFDTLTTRSGSRYWDSIYIGQEAIDLSPDTGGNDGHVGSYTDLNQALHPIYSIDMALADYRLFATGSVPFPVTTQGGNAGTGSQQHVASGWWDGGAYCRIVPPTVDQYERGINLANLHRNGTLAIRDFNLRFEMRYGPTIGTAYWTQGNGCKHALIQFAPTLGGSGNTSGRPVYFMQPTSFADNATHRRTNTLAFAPAANTLVAYGEAVYDDEDSFNGGTNTYYINGPQGFYLVDQSDAATTFLSKPCFHCGEFLTVEYRMISIATAQYPNGLIAMRYTNRAGIMVERGIPWNYKNFFAMNQFLDGVAQFGCGQFNFALPAGAGNYFDVGGYITLARDYGGWLDPRQGFVTG